MRISSIEPTSVIFSQKRSFKSWKMMSKKGQKQAKTRILNIAYKAKQVQSPPSQDKRPNPTERRL